MPSHHSTAMLRDFALTLGTLAFLAGVIWLGWNVEWTRPWIIGWLLVSVILTPMLLVLFSANGRDEEGDGE